MAKRKTRRTKKTKSRKSRRSKKTGGMRLMKSVARKVTLSLAESKRFTTLNVPIPTNSNGNATQWFVRNVFAGTLATGTGSYSIIGSEIQHPMLKVKFTARVNYATLFSDNPLNVGTVSFNMALIATNDQIGNTTDTPSQYGLSPFSGLNWFYNQDGHKPTFNGNNVKVLKTWTKRTNPMVTTTNGPNNIVKGTMSYRWKRKLTYEDIATIPTSGGPTSANILKGWNYYLLYGYALPTFQTSSLTSQSVFSVDSFLYFKDP